MSNSFEEKKQVIQCATPVIQGATPVIISFQDTAIPISDIPLPIGTTLDRNIKAVACATPVVSLVRVKKEKTDA